MTADILGIEWVIALRLGQRVCNVSVKARTTVDVDAYSGYVTL